MLKFYLIVCSLLWGHGLVLSQVGLKISGKIRVLEPTEVIVKSIIGETVFSTPVAPDGTFVLGPKEIVPDVYVVCVGSTCQPVYLTNTEVTVKGFYNCRDVEKSALVFTDIDKNDEILVWMPKERWGGDRKIAPEVKGKLEGAMYSALAYMADIPVYEPNWFLLECVPAGLEEVPSVKWLRHRVDSLKNYTIGAQAYDFKFRDSGGKEVHLSDFKGKFVLVDFWASWCGPCRSEMKSLLPIYQVLKGDDLEFISISLDSKEGDWRKMLEEEKLPWVMLWDEEGFVVGNGPNVIQQAYGFYSIPFIVLIDKEGRFLGRDLRGEQVREAIVKAREN